MFNFKIVGGILLIIGTSIGGGMLALPVATAALGIHYAILFLCICWLIMTGGALLLLEVNLALPEGTNIISMAKHTFGFPGQLLAWITYLFLLYTLLSGYISGGSDVLTSLLASAHFFDAPYAKPTATGPSSSAWFAAARVAALGIGASGGIV